MDMAGASPINSNLNVNNTSPLKNYSDNYKKLMGLYIMISETYNKNNNNNN